MIFKGRVSYSPTFKRKRHKRTVTLGIDQLGKTIPSRRELVFFHVYLGSLESGIRLINAVRIVVDHLGQLLNRFTVTIFKIQNHTSTEMGIVRELASLLNRPPKSSQGIGKFLLHIIRIP